MGVIPRKFYCQECRRDRWPGDCSHGRSAAPQLDEVSALFLAQDRCGRCDAALRACKCRRVAQTLKVEARRQFEESRVRAITSCECPHHLEAYRVGDADKTVRCGKCCSKTAATELIAGMTISPVSPAGPFTEVVVMYDGRTVTAKAPVVVDRQPNPGSIFPPQPPHQSIQARMWQALKQSIACSGVKPARVEGTDWMYWSACMVRLGCAIEVGRSNGLYELADDKKVNQTYLKEDLAVTNGAAFWSSATSSDFEGPVDAWGDIHDLDEDLLPVQAPHSELIRACDPTHVQRYDKMLVGYDKYGPRVYVMGLQRVKVKRK